MKRFDLLPPAAGIFAALTVFALAIALVVLHSLFAVRAAEHASLSDRARRWLPGLVAGFLSLWLGVALIVADRVNFPLTQTPLGVGSLGVPSLLVALVPFAVVIGVLLTSSSWRAANAATPPSWLIAAQTYRIAGFMFLYPYLYYGVLPAGFALPAGIGDALTGLLAPIVAWQVARGRPGARSWAVAWNGFGILDLIVAPAAAILGHAPVAIYPIALIPLFLGPPLGILTHIHSLHNLAAAGKRHSAGTTAFAAQPVGT